MKKGMTKKCPKCGASFQCFGDADCWCENVQIHKPEMLKIIENFNDCLCPACLAEYAEK